MSLNIRRIDSQKDDLRAEMDLLRQRLSPSGDVVSQEGRRRTIEIFGDPLTPVQVVSAASDFASSTQSSIGLLL